MVSRVVSHDIVKFNIVDLIGRLSLEPLADQIELSITNLELHCVKNGPEPCIGNETRVALVLILEERLNQKSLVFNLNTYLRHYLI